MAGSLNHIVDDHDGGRFTMDLIENMRDAREALVECHQIIAVLLSYCGGQLPSPDPYTTLIRVTDKLGYPAPDAMPVIQPELHGAGSKYR